MSSPPITRAAAKTSVLRLNAPRPPSALIGPRERRAVRRQRLGAGGQRLARLLEQRLERRRVGDGRLTRAAHDDRLEVLAAEHGADAAAARDALAFFQ